MRFIRKTIQFGLPRSGSTLIYNIIKDVVPYARVKKVHDLRRMNRSLPMVCTYRNPLDIMASLFESQKIPLDEASIDHQIVLLNLSGIWDMALVREQSNVLMLKYEDFYSDLHSAVTAVSRFLKVDLSNDRQEEIVDRYQIEVVKKRTDTLGGFSEVDKRTKFHGSHVSRFKGQPGYYTEIFSPEQIATISRSFYFFMQRFGYGE